VKRLLVFLSAAVFVLGIALFLISNPTAVSSSDTNMKKESKENKLVSVKTYNLAGDGIKIAFSMKNSKALELVYEDKQGERKFSEHAIKLEKLELGDMPSVVLEQKPGSHIITFTLAVPSANRTNNQKSIPVKTFGVRTTIRTSMAGPRLVEGQIKTYEIHVLEGTAW
jgi:hypothetical protein